MRRRIKAGDKPAKTRRRKTVTRKRSFPAKATPGRRSATTDQETGIVRVIRERDEAVERERATAEVLRLISSSAGELKPVFEAVLENATRLCEAKFGVLWLSVPQGFRCVALNGVPPLYAKKRQREPTIDPGPETALGRVAITKQVVHVDDIKTSKGYLSRDPLSVATVELAGARTFVAVPALKDNELRGIISIYRQEVCPFTDKQIELVQNFAAQAVIAIENARLLNELHQRTVDLTESLEQQTATSEVLRVISSSPGDLEPVFTAMLRNAARICEANFGVMFRFDEDVSYVVATLNLPPTVDEFFQQRGRLKPTPGSDLDTLWNSKQVVHTLDMLASPAPSRIAKLAGVRTQLAVPMLFDDKLIGAINLHRRDVRPFTDKQIALVQNFAAQAVIAIENTRLLNELRQSLEQQTATSEVLRVISSSPGDLTPVFETALASATRLCEASFGVLVLQEGDVFRVSGMHNVPAAFEELRRRDPTFRPGPLNPVMRAAVTKKPVHITDLADDAAYKQRDPAAVLFVEVAGTRTLLVVPMLKEGELIGAIAIYRQEARVFSEKQIELVENFAAQAVIAIDNARLLSDLRESLQQQTATAEVLRVISSSPGELTPVFEGVIDNATRLCQAQFGGLFLRTDNGFRNVALHGAPSAHTERWKQQPAMQFVEHPYNPLTRVAQTKDVVHIADLRIDLAYRKRDSRTCGLVESAGARTLIGVPMLRDGEVVGAIGMYRKEVRPFTVQQIDLVRNFAAQAVIAIENARLLDELRQRTTDLSKSLDDLRAAQDRLVQTQKLASLGQLTAGIAHEIKNPLNFVNNFSGLSVELLDELQEAVESGAFDDARRSEIAELTDTLRGNLEKIAQHGKRADSIVKNMLLHSREGSGEQRTIDINAIVEESLNLAYHGARAEKHGFNILLQRSFDPDAGQADLYPQEVSRALLNFISNGFYAATKRQQEIGEGYEPTLVAATKNLGDRVEIRIRDNGTGMPPEVKEKIFNPFFTTKPAGEGTGLGLSISHDIIVKQHLGSIEVDSALGEFTEIRIVLPRTTGVSRKPGG